MSLCYFCSISNILNQLYARGAAAARARAAPMPPAGGANTPESMTRKAASKGPRISLRDHIFLTLDNPGFSLLAKAYATFMILLIVMATVCLVLETEAASTTTAPGFLTHDDGAAHRTLEQLETVMVSVFTLDYTARLVTCPCHPRQGCARCVVRFVLAPYNVIDALSCLPYWVTLAAQVDSASFGAVRIVRLLRVFRIVKMGRFSRNIKMVMGSLARSRSSLVTMLTLLIVGVIMISVILNFLESLATPTMLSDAGTDAEVRKGARPHERVEPRERVNACVPS